MADRKKTQLDEATTLAAADIFEIVQFSSSESKRIRADNARDSFLGVTYAKETSSVTVGNTADETSIFSTTITGGDMGATGWLRVTVMGSIIQNTGSSKIFTVKMKLGSTTLCSATATMLASANVGALRIVGYIANTSALAQKAVLYNEQIRTNIANQSKGIIGTGAEDTSTNKTLDITVQWASAVAEETLTKTIAMVELLP